MGTNDHEWEESSSSFVSIRVHSWLSFFASPLSCVANLSAAAARGLTTSSARRPHFRHAPPFSPAAGRGRAAKRAEFGSKPLGFVTKPLELASNPLEFVTKPLRLESKPLGFV